MATRDCTGSAGEITPRARTLLDNLYLNNKFETSNYSDWRRDKTLVPAIDAYQIFIDMHSNGGSTMPAGAGREVLGSYTAGGRIHFSVVGPYTNQYSSRDNSFCVHRIRTETSSLPSRIEIAETYIIGDLTPDEDHPADDPRAAFFAAVETNEDNSLGYSWPYYWLVGAEDPDSASFPAHYPFAPTLTSMNKSHLYLYSFTRTLASLPLRPGLRFERPTPISSLK